MDWKKTFQVSGLANILVLFSAVILFLEPRSAPIAMVTINFFILLPLFVYFGYKARQKFDNKKTSLFVVLIPLLLVMIMLFFVSTIIYILTTNYDKSFGVILFLFIIELLEIFVVFVAGAMFGYWTYPKIKNSRTLRYGLIILYLTVVFYIFVKLLESGTNF